MRIRLVKDEQGRVRQFVDEEMSILVSVKQTSEEKVSQYLRHVFVRPFNLFGKEPLCRFEVFATDEHCWLLWDFHHVIADGITIAHHFIGRDLPAAYDGKDLEPECIDITSKCYPSIFQQAEAEENSFDGKIYRQSRENVLSTFKSIEMTRLGGRVSSFASTLLDTQHAREVTRTPYTDTRYRVPTYSTYVNRAAVDAWCNSHHARPHAFLMTAFNVVLAKFCHTRHLAYVTLFHGRSDRCLRDAYGMFVKTLPVACEVNRTDSVEKAVENVQRRLFSAIRHSAYPFTHFCHDIQVAPGITFAFQGENILEQVSIDGHTAKGIQLEHDAMDGELSCVVYCQENEYEIRTEALDDGCNPNWAVLVAQAMKNGVEFILARPETHIGDVDIVSEVEKKSLLLLSQGEQMALDKDKTWLDDFLGQVKTSPDALAVCDGKTSLTYLELERKSAALATRLLQDSVGVGDFIGVEANPCTAFLVAVIGVMRTGAAYVPIDPHWPVPHRQNIIEEAQLEKIVRMDSLDFLGSLECLDSLENLPHLDSLSPAYVIFTSGTTRQPKGVVVPHRALHNLARFIVSHWRLSASSRISCHSSLVFDGSMEDLFPVLTVGGSVHIMPEEVRRNPDAIHCFIDQYQITGGCYTTAMAPLLATRQHPSLDYICLGGEKLQHHPDMSCHLFNTYGPTEFTVDATYYELSSDDDTDIPIGRPLSNCNAYVTDIFGMLLPKGAVGELCLQGPQMALGYLHDPTLTAEKFTGCSFTDGIIYHTGDLVRWDEHNLLHYVSRQDHQVKVNGFRIAIDEVENRIASLDHILQVAVNLQKKGTNKVLCAFFTADMEMSSQQMKKALREKCPDYMIPAFFVQMERLPLTATGKVDYKRLYISHLQQVKSDAHRMPENEQERLFCRIFAKVLDVEDFGTTDDFFQLGGTSIMVMQVMMESEKAGVHIQYGDVFRNPTPQLLARYINEKTRAKDINIAEYDYTTLHRFLAEHHNPSKSSNSSLSSLSSLSSASSSSRLSRKILLTGATGFLGVHVLWQLLKDGNSCGCDTSLKNDGGRDILHPNILCMVRAASETKAWERLEDTWRYYFGLPLKRQQIRVFAGDLTDSHIWQSLADMEIDLVINCAADVRYFAPRDTIIEVNTHAVCRLADYCLAHHARLVHISTLSVAGFSSSGKPLALSDQELYIGQEFHEQYSLSKFLAERALLERMASHGLDAQIVRIGNLTARQSDGRFLRNTERNAFAMALRVMTENNMIPRSATKMDVDVSPVDVVAKELTELVNNDASVGLIHLTHPHKGGLPDLLQRMTGRPVHVVDDKEFKFLDFLYLHRVADDLDNAITG